MMGGGSGAIGMITSIRNNRKLLRKKQLFKKDKSFLGTSAENYKAAEGKIDIKKLSPLELKKIKNRVLKSEKKENRKSTFIAMCFLLQVLFYGFFQIYQYNQVQNIDTKRDNSAILAKQQKMYQFYISDGDFWIGKKHWNNAIFQYKKALEVYPNDFDASYKLAIAYSFKCTKTKEACLEGKKLTEELAKQFPEKSEILILESIFSDDN